MNKLVSMIALLSLIVVPCIAVDIRETSYSVPFLAPDITLKTTDPFYIAQGAATIGQINALNGYRLPPVLTGDITQDDTPDWMNLSNVKNSENKTITVSNLYELTDDQLNKYGVKPGQESWL